MDEVQEKATRQYEEARREVAKALTGKPGNRAEVEYGEAHQRLVVLGLAPKMKQKYRTPKKYR